MGNLLQIVFLPVPVPERIAQDVPDTHLWPGDEQEIKSTFPFCPGEMSSAAGMPGKTGCAPSTPHRPTLDPLRQTGIVRIEADRGRGFWKERQRDGLQRTTNPRQDRLVCVPPRSGEQFWSAHTGT